MKDNKGLMMDLPARIGPYRVTRKLGEGGMRVVYAAVDEKLDRPVAVKTIRDAGADTATRERFWREARGLRPSAPRTSASSTRSPRMGSSCSW